MIKLIFCDMDGTLLDDAGQMPPMFDEVVGEILQRGAVFCPASGRQYSALLRQMGRYIDDFIFVAENGTMVMERDRELFSSPVDRALALDVMRTGEQIGGVRSVLCGKKQGYLHSADDAPEFRAELAKYVSQSAVVEDFATVDDLPIKMSFCDFTGHAEETILPVMQAYADRLQVSLSSTEWVDLYNLGVSKGVAARQIQACLGITPDECAAFGDYENDLELMDAVTHSFAMENAIPAVKERARYMAPSNSADGVMAVCERILAGEFD